MTKVLFLDVDGVLNNTASLAEGVDLLPEKVLLIRHICEQAGASIVISSTWRILFDRQTLHEFLRRLGLRNINVIDYTPQLRSGIRGDEIKHWLDNHPDVTNFVIIDDDSDMLDEQMPFFVKTHHSIGITTRDAKKAIKILQGDTSG